MMKVLWNPAAPGQTFLDGFRRAINDRHGLDLRDDAALHRWSIDDSDLFWRSLWDFFELAGDQGNLPPVQPDRMEACRFFPDASLNYVENLLRPVAEPEDVALYFWGENKIKRQLTHAALRAAVSRFQQFLHMRGVGPGDRVAALMANTPEAVVAMLAATSLGAIWSSASPDFGVQGVLDRFGQIEPKVFLASDGYFYNGKWLDCRPKLAEIIAQLPSVQEFILVPYDGHTTQPLSPMQDWQAVLSPFDARPLHFSRVAFDHPLFIMFSSGTTGKPKCIVHGTGGPLLQLMKEHRLHCDIRPSDRVFYFTTCSWMMWNWQVTALASGAALCLYDGSPFAPDGNILFDYADAVGFTLFGTSAKFIDTLHKQQFSPKKTHRLASLRTLTSTGSVLVPEAFDYVYDHIKSDLHLASISGGTDIVSCFVLGYPTRPVIRGEIQGPGLGLAMDVFDENGTPQAVGQKGELVCTRPFPSMPVGFWRDMDGTKYHQAYFSRFDNIWTHGDYAEKTPSGGYIIHGRSDATLNPGGVRIGTAEIYRQVEKLPEIVESIVVGQQWQGDERVVLFVKLAPDTDLDDVLVSRIKKQIRDGASPRHVPAKIIAVRDIPRTKNNKISEIAVRDTVSGKPVANTEALLNPEALAYYRDLSELQQD